MKLQLAFHLLLLMILQFFHLPPLLSPPVSIFSCLFTQCQPLYAMCCVLLYFLRYCTVRFQMFIFFVFYVLFIEKYDKIIIVQYHIADQISWHLGQICCTYEQIVFMIRMKLVHMQGTYHTNEEVWEGMKSEACDISVIY